MSMSEERQQSLLAEFGELCLKLETLQAQGNAMSQRQNAIKKELQIILKAEEEADEGSGD